MSCMEKNLPQSRGLHIPIFPTRLEAELRIPAGANSLIMFAHANRSSRQSWRSQLFAQTIRDAGFGTLFFDLLTQEEEAVDRITRQFRFDIPLLAERLVRATRWVKKQPAIEHLRTGYFGARTGGAAALVAAAEFGDEVGAVVSCGGRADLAGDALPQVTAPTLLIVGELDDFVLELNRQAYQKLRCEKAIKVVPKASYGFEETGASEAVAVLASEWFQKHLPPNERYSAKDIVI